MMAVRCWTRAVGAVLAGLLALTACADTGPVGDDPDPGRAEGTAPPATLPYAELHDAAEHMEVWGRLIAIGLDEHAALPGAPDSAAASLLSELDFLLRGHTAYTAQATRAALERRQEALVAALEVVGTTTGALETQIRELRGEEAATRFGELWRGHVEQVVRYAQAVATGDETSRQRAREELTTVTEELTALLTDHLGQRVERETIHSALERHVESTVALIEAQAGGGGWLTPLGEAVDHAGALAETLAVPLARVGNLAGDVTAPAARLRAALSGHMAQTVWFVAPLTRLAQGGDRPDLREGARALLARNSAGLEKAVGRALDERASARVAELWRVHNDLLVEAAVAVGEGEGALSGVRRTLEQEFGRPLGALLEDSTDGALQASTMRSEAAVHVETTFDLIEAQAG